MIALAYRPRPAGIQDLGVLEGDVFSQALGINERRQIVGVSCTAGFLSCRAVLWDHGRRVDLNAAVGRSPGTHLYAANDINNRGHITGEAVNLATRASTAFTASPNRHSRSALASPPAGSLKASQHQPLPASVRARMLSRTGVAESDLPD